MPSHSISWMYKWLIYFYSSRFSVGSLLSINRRNSSLRLTFRNGEKQVDEILSSQSIRYHGNGSCGWLYWQSTVPCGFPELPTPASLGHTSDFQNSIQHVFALKLQILAHFKPRNSRNHHMALVAKRAEREKKYFYAASFFAFHRTVSCLVEFRTSWLGNSEAHN